MIRDTRNDDPIVKLFNSLPGGIEAQEASGQRELVRSSQLPKKCGGYSNTTAAEIYEKMGIAVIGPSSSHKLFLDVELPNGWKKHATDHAMWSHLLDDKGRKRASIFYKAAFYDCDAFINLERRFDYRVFNYLPEEQKGHYEKKRVQVVEERKRSYYDEMMGYITEINHPKYEMENVWVPRFKDHYEEKNNTPNYIEVYDGEKVIYSTKDKPMFFKKKYQEKFHSKWWKSYERFERRMKYEATKFLNEKYPGWENAFAYWD